ncbi:class I SAM-dependent methyltransferase [Turneriella parva]|uniref:class I SAM-dependent methyltransferase n=1 Tax=Turneriella parva TaxID=29510 RepID=UPI0012F692F3|nr:class I SAM-dependent methyltransferase [Turneriella parva]
MKYRIKRHGFDVFACADCHSEFQHPFPQNADAYYDEGYYTGTSAFNYQDERKQEYYHNFVHHARIKTIKRFCNGGNSPVTRINASVAQRPKLLDVGCAFGTFVRAAAKSFEATGLDVSGFAVDEGNKINAAQNNPARLWQGDLTHLPRSKVARETFSPGSFAAITLIEVAEHLSVPRESFAEAYRLLAPGGVLVIQTANFEGWQAVRGGADYHYYLPGHLVYYTATGLKTLLAQIGFREFREFYPVDFSLCAKWRKAWGDIKTFSDLGRYWKMSLYHLKSKMRWRGRPLTSSYVLYARK